MFSHLKGRGHCTWENVYSNLNQRYQDNRPVLGYGPHMILHDWLELWCKLACPMKCLGRLKEVALAFISIVALCLSSYRRQSICQSSGSQPRGLSATRYRTFWSLPALKYCWKEAKCPKKCGQNRLYMIKWWMPHPLGCDHTLGCMYTRIPAVGFAHHNIFFAWFLHELNNAGHFHFLAIVVFSCKLSSCCAYAMTPLAAWKTLHFRT